MLHLLCIRVDQREWKVQSTDHKEGLYEFWKILKNRVQQKIEDNVGYLYNVYM